ncbi:MAG: sulfotransferase [Myxococcota bacterium]
MFNGPLFLVGMPRSGTKLLRGLLNEHPQIGIPLNETEFYPDWRRRWATFGDLSDPARFDQFYEAVTGSVYFVHRREEHGLQIDPRVWQRRCRSFSSQGVFEALVRHDADVPWDTPGVWGDKSPGYLVHLQTLKADFPQARFIHIIRDVRDYCLSMKTAFGKSMTRAAQRWRNRIEGARHVAHTFPDDYTEVRYEDLLADPTEEVERLCQFIGVDFSPEMLELSRAPENIGDARGRRTIKRDNAEKWRTKMDPGKRRLIERIAGDVLRSLEYPVETQGRCTVSRPHMLALQIYDGLQLTRRQVQKRGVVEAIRFQARLFRETRSGAG